MVPKRMIKTDWETLSPLLTDCMAQGTDVVIPITGTSMLPLLHAGVDRVLLTAAEGDALQVGDIPLYRRKNGQFVLHRVVAITPGGYTMQGDNQTFLEPGIQPDQILAVAKGIYQGETYRPCTHWRYRLYTRMWSLTRPMRPLLLRVYHAGKRLKDAVRRRL